MSSTQTVVDEQLIKELIKHFDERYVIRKPPVGTSTGSKKRKLTTTVDLETEEKYLLVPFDKRTEVKDAGAWWDEDKRLWFIPDGFIGDRTVFDKYRKFVKEGNVFAYIPEVADI